MKILILIYYAISLFYSLFIIIALFKDFIEAYNTIINVKCASRESIAKENANIYFSTNYYIDLSINKYLIADYSKFNYINSPLIPLKNFVQSNEFLNK